MNANEITFGIEIECFIPYANCPTVGGYHCGTQIADLPAGWNSQSDANIQSPIGTRGIEVVSPVLKGEDGIEQIAKVCEWLKRVGARVNKSTGLHVHIGCDQSPETLKKIVTVVANFEKAIYASTGTKSRENGNYCRSVKHSYAHRNGNLSNVDRYRVLNVKTNKPTVEFRAFAGTTNFVKIVSYVRLCVGLAQRSLTMKKIPQWDAKAVAATSPIKRGGEGMTALNRLFYWLGWTAGRVETPFGIVGEIAGPKMKKCKAELVKLAKKYDGPVAPVAPAVNQSVIQTGA